MHCETPLKWHDKICEPSGENASPQVSVPGVETSVNVVKQALAATFDSQHWLPFFEAAYERTLLNF